MSIAVDLNRNLLDLRFLHERGVQEIRHPTPGRRAVGVILLDAANERAVFEASTTLALPEKRELDAQVSALAAHLGDKWETSSRTTVSRLHKARNGVQHQGLGIDPASIEQWIAASRAFVEDIIEAVYDVSIWTLTAADALDNPEWAALLRTGEDHAANGRYPDAVTSYAKLFTQLDRRLQELGASSTSAMPFPNDIMDQKTYQFLKSRIEESARLSWFSTIAVDSFELHWFENLIREMRWASREDADRAHTLIFWAVTAFQSINSEGRPDRRLDWELGQRACRPAGSDAPARAVSQRVSQQRDGLRVEVMFADVPNDEFDLHMWAFGVRRAIDRGDGISFVSMDGAGALRFSVAYRESYEFLAALVQGAIAAGEDEIRAGRAEMAQRDSRRQEIVDRLSPTICDDGVPPWILEQEIGFSETGSGSADVPVVVLSISDDLNRLPHEASLWRFVHDKLDGVQFYHRRDGRHAFAPVDRWKELVPVLQEFDVIQRERLERQARVDADRARSEERLKAAFRSINIPEATD